MCGHTASPQILAFHSMPHIFSRRATISEYSTALVFLRCGPGSGCGVDQWCDVGMGNLCGKIGCGHTLVQAHEGGGILFRSLSFVFVPVPRHGKARRRDLSLLTLCTGNVEFTWFYLTETLISHDFTTRWSYVYV
jgi:hypothetical protein